MNFEHSLTPQQVPGSNVGLVFAPGALDHIGEIARAQNATRVLLVTDPGIVKAGHVERAMRSLYRAGIAVRLFDGVEENPTTIPVGRGVIMAKPFAPDLIIGLGGGSSMDCAKGINFLLTSGGRMQDYWGTGKAKSLMLPMIAIPTTAGTGSEAQSYALITDPETHQKMACGDKRALPRSAVLDPDLTSTQPRNVAAATGIDAIAHAVETSACTRRNQVSRNLSKEAWKRLESSFEKALTDPTNIFAREGMLLGAHLAGAAIENSMLGAAHACANPLTAEFGITHGVAVGLMLPHVIRFNIEGTTNPYSDLMAEGTALAKRIEALLRAAHLPTNLATFEIRPEALDKLAAGAAKQWTAGFNPRTVGEGELMGIYRAAL